MSVWYEKNVIQVRCKSSYKNEMLQKANASEDRNKKLQYIWKSSTDEDVISLGETNVTGNAMPARRTWSWNNWLNHPGTGRAAVCVAVGVARYTRTLRPHKEHYKKIPCSMFPEYCIIWTRAPNMHNAVYHANSVMHYIKTNLKLVINKQDFKCSRAYCTPVLNQRNSILSAILSVHKSVITNLYVRWWAG